MNPQPCLVIVEKSNRGSGWVKKPRRTDSKTSLVKSENLRRSINTDRILMMDSGEPEEHDSDEGEYQSLEEQDMVQYRVCYSHPKYTKELDFCKKEDVKKKRCPAGRSGNNPGRQKRVVSCKRKTHHLNICRRKQPATWKTYDVANKENEMACVQDMEEIFYMDPWEFPLTAPHPNKTDEAGSKNSDYFTELSKDHNTMTEVLFGRNLRLSVALTLWQRNVGELLTYFLRIQDTGVFVDFLPVITKSLDGESESPSVSIGCCVDLFPLVKKVLTTPYEEHLVAGLRLVQSVLRHWWPELSASGGTDTQSMDGNIEVFKQQLKEFWNQEPHLSSVPGSAGEIAKVIDYYLLQLP
ncbi:KATNB1-like protein 1 [Salvelinus fontinalis]|uniref:KATNB1-like protein 1 n=1 Tax=Salvelinus fontinalis TaxID=8038 RepID=UPI002485D380|nr:KATNB1-like protein 1 [Salvelinus fontinalis]